MLDRIGHPKTVSAMLDRAPENGQALVILEEKFTSKNPVVNPGEPREKPISLEHREVLIRYLNLELKMVDVQKAKDMPLPQRLYRYAVLGEWMAMMSDTAARFFLCSLTRHGHENDTCDLFRQLLRPEYQGRFNHLSWDHLYHMTNPHRYEVAHLRQYMERKTVNLKHHRKPEFFR